MKKIIYILAILILASCGQSNSDRNNDNSEDTDIVVTDTKGAIPDLNNSENDRTDFENQSAEDEFKYLTIFELGDTISADFNGDGNVDQAVYKKENETSGIIIKHGQTNEEVKVGFGEPFAHLSEFNWVDYWGLVKDDETYEIVIEDAEIIGDRNVKLENPSILVRKREVGGGLITFKNGKYVWIHQAD